MPNVPNGVPEQGMGGAADLSALKASPEERSQMRTQLLTQVGLLCAGCGERIRDRGIKMVIDAPGQKPGAVAIAAANFCSQECPHFVEACSRSSSSPGLTSSPRPSSPRRSPRREAGDPGRGGDRAAVRLPAAGLPVHPARLELSPRPSVVVALLGRPLGRGDRQLPLHGRPGRTFRLG